MQGHSTLHYHAECLLDFLFHPVQKDRIHILLQHLCHNLFLLRLLQHPEGFFVYPLQKVFRPDSGCYSKNELPGHAEVATVKPKELKDPEQGTDHSDLPQENLLLRWHQKKYRF